MDDPFPRVDAQMNDISSPDRTFEQSLAELDRVVRDLEEGQLGLEDALTRYEAGVNLLKDCFSQLRDAEQRILRLAGLDADGRPVLQPFEHAATAEVSQGKRKK
jgi:exodeoxyribonuclease VII small subunit